jgi:hypothetical protein
MVMNTRIYSALFVLLIAFFSCTDKPSTGTVSLESKEQTAESTTKTISTAIVINTHELGYTCFNCTPSYTDSVTVFAKKDSTTKALFTLVLGDYYFSALEVFRQQKEVFLWVQTSHTYGHTLGYLYHIDTTTFEATAIKPPKSNFAIPDSLEIWRIVELQLENNEFTNDASFRSAVNKETYTYTGKLALQKTNNNKFSLHIINEQLVKEE